MHAPVTLDNCEREPIHIPGAIQPHGVLLACRQNEGLSIVIVSANAAELFRRPVGDLHGVALGSLFDDASAATLAACGKRKSLREVNPLHLTTRGGDSLEAVVHRSGGLFVVELEQQRAREHAFDPRLRDAIVRLQTAQDVESLVRVAAEEVRAITGFDRVMVYRFDPEWNGQVVAEARRDDLEPFLGLHYPASDIPAQARQLYARNWLRLIADIGYTPSPLVPERDPETQAPLDMSAAHLRSVSPIHIEYLRNMGVTASMSVSLVTDGDLKGLIACHHYSGPHLVPFHVRETAEYLGQALSWNLRVLEHANRAMQAQRVQGCETQIAQVLATTENVVEGLAVPALVELTNAAGAAVVLDEGIRTVGKAPDERCLREIVEWLRTNQHDVFFTDHLASQYPAAEGWDDVAAGLLAVAVARDLGEYLLWFRPSTERVVDWAGDPRKQVTQVSGAPPRLSPRGSFALWRETVRGRALPWEPWEVEAASNIRRLILGGVRRKAVALRALNARLMEADRAKDIFIATVSHELRTPLNAISGWTTLLAAGRLDGDKRAQALDVVARNTGALTRLVEDLIDVSRIVGGKLSLEISSVDVIAVVEAVIDSLALAAEAKSIRIRRVFETGPLIVLGDIARIRQIASNVLSNAIKFTPKGGSVTISVHRRGSDVQLVVRDTGPGIEPEQLANVFSAFWQADSSTTRKSQGLGLGLAIAKKLVDLHGGTILAESEGLSKGSTFTVRFPIASTHPVERDPDPSTSLRRAEKLLAGMTILVVEDEPDSRELLVHIIEDEGAHVFSAANAPEALTCLSQTSIDAIVSDIGLPEMDGLELLRKVRANAEFRMPAVALTAYTRAFDRTAAMRAGFQAHVPKPADPDELIAVLASLLGRITPHRE